MRLFLPTALVLLILVALTPAAFAGGFYITGKLADTSLDGSLGDSFGEIVDGDDTGWSLGVGFRLGKYLAFQAEYNDLGSSTGTGSACSIEDLCIALVVPLEVDSTAISVTVLPHLPLTERLSLYGKLGFVSFESDVSAIEDAGESFIEDFDDEDIVYGVGVRFKLFGPLGVFAEYESIAGTFETVSLGATLGF